MHLALICGSTRAVSTNRAALDSLRSSAPEGSTAEVYEGLAELPAFNPDDDQPPPPAVVVHLRAAVAGADAVVFCTPEYAGTLPGSVKNLLDWTVGDTVMNEKPVAWINVAAPGRGGGALATLRVVLGYVSATIIESACIEAPIVRNADGAVEIGLDTVDRIAGVWNLLAVEVSTDRSR